MAQGPISDDDKIARLRRIAGQIRPRKLPEIRLPDFDPEEEPTKVDVRPGTETIPPRSLPARAAKGAADGWKATPRPVQIIAAVTALVGALTPVILAILEAFK